MRKTKTAAAKVPGTAHPSQNSAKAVESRQQRWFTGRKWTREMAFPFECGWFLYVPSRKRWMFLRRPPILKGVVQPQLN